MNDFIPLCDIHHKEIHRYLKRYGRFVESSADAIKGLYGINRKQLKQRLKGIIKKRPLEIGPKQERRQRKKSLKQRVLNLEKRIDNLERLYLDLKK